MPLLMRKIQKVGNVNIQSDCKTTSKKRTNSSLDEMEKYEKADSFNTQNDYKASSKKWTDKQTCSMYFVKVFKFQEKKFKIGQKISRKI